MHRYKNNNYNLVSQKKCGDINKIGHLFIGALCFKYYIPTFKCKNNG